MSLSIHGKTQQLDDQDDALLLLLDPEHLSPLEMSLAGVCGRSTIADGALLDILELTGPDMFTDTLDETLLPSAAKKKTARRDEDDEDKIGDVDDDDDDVEDADEEEADGDEDVDDDFDDEEEDEDDDDEDEDEEEAEVEPDSDFDDDDDEDDFDDDE